MARPRRTSAASDLSSVPEQHQELGSMYDYLAKIILLGPSGTGKSCLLHRFISSEWRVLSSQTIGVEFSSKIIKIGTTSASTGQRAKRIKLQLWDTAGTERFRSVSRSYYRGAAGAVLVYDVANLASFQQLPTFLSDARALASPRLTVVLAGNKADLADGATSQHAQTQAQNAGGTGTRTQGIHMNGSAHLHRLPKDDDPAGGGFGGNATPPASSASSLASSFPLESSTPTSTSTTTRPRTDSLQTPTPWTATLSLYGREVPPGTASTWASKTHIPYVTECSALDGSNVDALFYRLAAMILTKIELGEIDPDDPSSGIQYGDGGGDGDSLISDGGGGGTVRRRKGRKGVLNGLGEWEDVFRRPAGRGGRCC
ncbi:hypothetical protein H2200_000388 [Cladophialophora chaetospira]|uniref:GTP-binding protein ypt4 n=1 Tax=Cladophialophora chaetospira TaxID=386627 RepID=A0AA38XNF7_9EURO|nr:hypothetical protein H2200_000388 [Cladophialophora chaetospira]